MKIEKITFDKIFENTFWKKLNESIVPFNDKVDKKTFLNELYDEIASLNYHPSHPREYIVSNKHNGIPRHVPTFNRKDYCVFYLCIKLLEHEIAINRIKGTFGGWQLGNPIKLKEQEEILESDYSTYNTFNKTAWKQEWGKFQHIAKTNAADKKLKFIIKLDIANFYDSINLNILERKIRPIIPKEKQDVVTLLIHFLSSWNKKFEGYNSKTVGLPQDEIGDCSRILANFYLQDYDAIISDLCSKESAKYIRYSDDQIFYTNSKESAEKILFFASRELLKINLNFNSGKVKVFKNKKEFNTYWSFSIFDDLIDGQNKTKINRAIKSYFQNIDNKINFRDSSVLKRIMTVNFNKIQPSLKHKLLSIFLDEDFLVTANMWHYRKIRAVVNNDKQFFNLLDNQIKKILFNSFHYHLMEFYKKDRKGYDFSILLKRVNDLKI